MIKDPIQQAKLKPSRSSVPSGMRHEFVFDTINREVVCYKFTSPSRDSEAEVRAAERLRAIEHSEAWEAEAEVE